MIEKISEWVKNVLESVRDGVRKMLGYCPECKKYFRYPKVFKVKGPTHSIHSVYQCQKCMDTYEVNQIVLNNLKGTSQEK